MSNSTEQSTGSWMRWAILLLLAINLASLAGLWFKPNPQLPPPPPSRLAGSLEQDLNLTEEQMEVFSELRNQHHQQVQQLARKLRARREALYAADSWQITDSELQKRLDAVGEVQRELDALTHAHFQEMRDMLEPEQQERFDEVMPVLVPQLGRGPGPGGPGGPGRPGSPGGFGPPGGHGGGPHSQGPGGPPPGEGAPR